MEADYWRKARIAVMGAGSWGTVLAVLAARNCAEVRIFARDEEACRAINGTRVNPRYSSGMPIPQNVRAFSELERVFEGGVQCVIWALPSKVCRAVARSMAGLMSGEEILIHATKGAEPGTLKRISEILAEELPCPRIGVLSGPNLAEEISRGEPAATVVASRFTEVVAAGQAVLASERFRVYGADDVIGVEWAGTLKNILAIAAGALDALRLGWNTRSMLISRGLAEMVRFGVAMGAKESTFLGLAGVGDLLATCSSPLSRNYRVGFGLGQGKGVAEILQTLGATAEGVETARSVHEYARKRGISMPITEGVFQLVEGGANVEQVLQALMTRPSLMERG